MLRWSVLLGALLVTAPTIWAAFGAQTISVSSALVHYLVAVPIVAVLLALVRLAARPAAPRRPGTAKKPTPGEPAP
ncbi:hypothetical protein [uncultured Jatrophihabitans sp.]|uniref:hypothetical protein n=1 Tax=uncultured Jatrophihabitans sp. TaxID=1610747 RepID=UPI0035CA61A5